MLALLEYTLEAGLIFYLLIAFYNSVYYSLCYNKWNRIFLLLTVFLSYGLPLLKIKHHVHGFRTEDVLIVDVTKDNGVDLITFKTERTIGTLWSEFLDSQFFENLVLIIFAVYVAGVAVKLFTFLRGLYKTLRLKLNPVTAVLEDGTKVYKINLNTVAFSFFSNIFVGKKAESLDEKDLKIIFAHEKQHIKGRHSVDTLIFGLYSVLQWYNPAVKRASRHSRFICENIADSSVGGDVSDYSRLILRLGASNTDKEMLKPRKKRLNSSIAQRIIHLFNRDSNEVKKTRFLLSLPVLAFLVATYIVLAGIFTREREGWDVPVDGRFRISCDFFENYTYLDDELYVLSHRQIDLQVATHSKILAPMSGKLNYVSDNEIMMMNDSITVFIGGILVKDDLSDVRVGDVIGKPNQEGHPVFIKTCKNGKIVNPKSVFKL